MVCVYVCLCVCLCVCMCVWVCVCVSVINITKKKLQKNDKIWHSTFLSDVDATWNFLQRSVKNSVYRGTQKNFNTLRLMDRISCQWIFICLDCTKCNEIHVYFCHSLNHTAEHRINCMHDLFTGQHKIIGIREWLWLDIIETSFPFILWNF